jgi:hypothetical protein
MTHRQRKSCHQLFSGSPTELSDAQADLFVIMTSRAEVGLWTGYSP